MPHPLSLDLPKDYWKGMPSLKYEGKDHPMREGSSLLKAIYNNRLSKDLLDQKKHGA